MTIGGPHQIALAISLLKTYKPGGNAMVSNRSALLYCFIDCNPIWWTVRTCLSQKNRSPQNIHTKKVTLLASRVTILHLEFWDTYNFTRTLCFSVFLCSLQLHGHHHSPELVINLFLLPQRHENNVSILYCTSLCEWENQKMLFIFATPRFPQLGNTWVRWISDLFCRHWNTFQMVKFHSSFHF